MTNPKKSLLIIALLVVLCSSVVYVLANQMQSSSHGVAVLKSATSFAYVGDIIEYEIRVYNPSDYDLLSINISDPMFSFNDTIPFLAARNTTGINYVLNREVMENDSRPLVNEVFVEAIDSLGAYCSCSTQAITAISERNVAVTKIGAEYASIGETIGYMITLNNTGDVDLLNVILEDKLLGFSWKGDLNKKESNIFNLTYVVPCNTKEHLTNVVTAEAQLNDTTFHAQASWTTKIIKPCEPRHSMGYWKNHPEKWPLEKIEIGNRNYTKEEALEILKGANSKDATAMLAAQLISAKLNRQSGTCPSFWYCNYTTNIDEIIHQADEFLTEHPVGSNPQCENRQIALVLKDKLDTYNNAGQCG